MLVGTGDAVEAIVERIQDTPLHERPRERCLERGAHALSLRECLALVLGSGPKNLGCLGIANLILGRPGSGLTSREEERAFFEAIEHSPATLVQEVRGLGFASRARLLAAFELAKRYARYREGLQKAHPPAGADALSLRSLRRIPSELRSESREWLGFVPCYRNSELGELCIVERGVRTHVNVDPAELFARILALRPAGFFLIHNHPSGNTSASSQDLDLTRRVNDLARQFGIRLLGHWIVTTGSEAMIGLNLH